MEIKEALEMMDMYYNRLCSCTSSSGRKYNGQAMIDLINDNPDILDYWVIDTSYYHWADRFIKIKEYETKNFERGACDYNKIVKNCINIFVNTPMEQSNKKAFDDGIDFNLPEKSGLYLIGETTFNPYTKKELFGIKVGKGKNLKQRIRSYKTCGSTPFVCDYLLVPEEKLDYAENMIQSILRIYCIALNGHNDEWFYFDEKTYLNICEKGFSYFD